MVIIAIHITIHFCVICILIIQPKFITKFFIYITNNKDPCNTPLTPNFHSEKHHFPMPPIIQPVLDVINQLALDPMCLNHFGPDYRYIPDLLPTFIILFCFLLKNNQISERVSPHKAMLLWPDQPLPFQMYTNLIP